MKNVIEYLKQTASLYPDKIAFRDDKSSLTFSELESSSTAIASQIGRRLRWKIHQPIAVYLPKKTECVAAFLAAAYSGNFYSPLDITMPPARLKIILDTLKPAAVLTDSQNISYLEELVPNTPVIIIEPVTPSLDSNDEHLEKIQNTCIDTDPLYVMFTSGSTGTPKGVVISHRSVLDYMEWLSDTFRFDSRTVFGNQAPFYFDNSILDIYATIKNGCEMVIIPEEYFLSPKRLCHYLDKCGVNTIFWVPSALSLVANSALLTTDYPRCLETILFCGEIMPMKQLNIWRRAIPHALYANLYGPTEITDVCTYFIVQREFDDSESLPIGFPCGNTEILVLNENKELVSGDEIGELCVRGSCLAHGYYNDKDKTKAAFIQNPLQESYPEMIYCTGDLVRYNEYGELLYAGRKDYQIKHMGHRIELGEIEAAAFSFSTVNQCCAFYDIVNQQIRLAVSPANIDKAALYQHLKSILPRYMLPKYIEAQGELPLTANGKIDRIKLKEIVLGGHNEKT